MSSRWLVIGRGGQLGRALVARLATDPHRTLLAALGRDALDLSDPARIAPTLEGLPEVPDVVVNAAAFTQVDDCESQRELCRRVNALAPGELARVCRKLGARLVHVSTDYVFDGRGRRPYREDDPPAPLCAYGETKLEGEQRVAEADPDALVVRTSWLYGEGRNFIGAILGQARRVRAGEIPELRVVDDQTGRPTYAADLAAGLVALVEAGCRGLYHLANSGSASWWDLARAALDHAGFGEVPIARVGTEAFPRPARRPAWSVLDLDKAERAGVRLRPWPAALQAYLDSDGSPTKAGESA